MRARVLPLCAAAVCACVVLLAGSPSGAVWYVPGSDGTYAQNYQDTWVANIAATHGWGRDGFFLDLGAYHGERCSNSALLERELGWNGICVEPFPAGFERRRCRLVERALHTRDNDTVRFHGSEQVRTIADKGDGSAKMPTSGGRVATTISVAGLIARYNVPKHVRFVSLDVEGMEVAVMRTWPFDLCVPDIFIIEHNNNAERHFELEVLLTAQGYVRVNVQHAGVDAYFVRKDLFRPEFGRKALRVHPWTSGGC